MAAVILKKIGYDASDVSVGWCWIDLEAEDRVLWMLLTGKLWEMLAYVTLPMLYLLIRKHINRAVGAPAGPLPPETPAQGSVGHCAPCGFARVLAWGSAAFGTELTTEGLLSIGHHAFHAWGLSGLLTTQPCRERVLCPPPLCG